MVDGYARYRADERWEQRQPRNTLQVDELHGLTKEASAALWRFLAEVDWVATVKGSRRSPSDPLPWLLTNGRAAAVSDVGDGVWVRIFDVPRALETRTYDRETRVVLEVVDAEAPAGRIRVDLDASPAGTSCRRHRQEPGSDARRCGARCGVPRWDAVARRGPRPRCRRAPERCAWPRSKRCCERPTSRGARRSSDGIALTRTLTRTRRRVGCGRFRRVPYRLRRAAPATRTSAGLVLREAVPRRPAGLRART